jgi:transposase/ribosomal protein L34
MNEPGGARVDRPDRTQLHWDMVDLEALLAKDHRVRVVWDFVTSLDLGGLYARVKAREGGPGRPTIDPPLLLALWLYATLEGIGSARLVERLCRSDVAYRWLCGGVGVNHHALSDFRVGHDELLDGLLTDSVAALAVEGLISLEEIAVDGTKLQAAAGRGSFRAEAGLAGYERAAAARVARLKAEIEADPGAHEAKRRAAVARAEREVAERAAKARAALEKLAAERKERAKTHGKEEAEKAKKGGPKASTTDPEARQMRFADGSVRPGYNLQLGCVPSTGIIVAVMATDRRNDTGLAQPMVDAIAKRYGMPPARLLVDTKYATQDDIVALSERCEAVCVYTPLPADSDAATAESKRKRQWRRRREPPAIEGWRTRMATDEGRLIMQRRHRIETVNGNIKNRGLGRLNVRGLIKVQCLALLHALAHNLWRAHVLRQAVA